MSLNAANKVLKRAVCVTIEKDLLDEVDTRIMTGEFHDRSHAINFLTKQAMMRGL